jgi:hypothetical protein
VTVPIKPVAAEKTMMAAPKMVVREATSARKPRRTPETVKTATKAGPAKIWYSMPRPLYSHWQWEDVSQLEAKERF